MSINNCIEKINRINKSIDTYEIEDDREFLFVCGQVLRYLINQSENTKDLEDIFNLKTVYNIKKRVIKKNNKYKHKCNNKKLELLVGAILSYKLDQGEINIKDEIFYYYGGLIGHNYIHDISIIEEIDNWLKN